MIRESKELPGYYEIEGFSKYLISKEAKVYSKLKKRNISTTRSATGYAYLQLVDDNGKRHCLTRHRLMAKVFLPLDGNFDDFQVNHIDGIPGNDWIGNLEWVTPIENREHAAKLGISTGPKIPVEVRDCISGEVTLFPSIHSCARDLKISKDSVRTRLTHPNGEKQIWPELKQYRKPEDRPWYIPKDYVLESSLCTSNLPVSVRDLLTNEVEDFNRSIDAAHALGIKPSTLSQWLDLEGLPVLPGLIQVKPKFDPRPWRHVEDPFLEYDQKGLHRCIVVIHVDTGITKVYMSAKKCADDLGLLTTTLNYRLQYSAGRVFKKERYVLFYYSDYFKSRFYNKESMSSYEVIYN